jgi:hypothetical protein
MSNNKDPEIRYCKKCGCELVSTNKYNYVKLQSEGMQILEMVY